MRNMDFDYLFFGCESWKQLCRHPTPLKESNKIRKTKKLIFTFCFGNDKLCSSNQQGFVLNKIIRSCPQLLSLDLNTTGELDLNCVFNEPDNLAIFQQIENISVEHVHREWVASLSQNCQLFDQLADICQQLKSIELDCSFNSLSVEGLFKILKSNSGLCEVSLCNVLLSVELSNCLVKFPNQLTYLDINGRPSEGPFRMESFAPLFQVLLKNALHLSVLYRDTEIDEEDDDRRGMSVSRDTINEPFRCVLLNLHQNSVARWVRILEGGVNVSILELTNLQMLDEDVSESLVNLMLKLCLGLNDIRFARCPQINWVANFTTNCSTLRKLTFRDCTYQPNQLNNICFQNPAIFELELYGCLNFTLDEAMSIFDDHHAMISVCCVACPKISQKHNVVKISRDANTRNKLTVLRSHFLN
jgi:hypothetical protein